MRLYLSWPIPVLAYLKTQHTDNLAHILLEVHHRRRRDPGKRVPQSADIHSHEVPELIGLKPLGFQLQLVAPSVVATEG